MYHCLHVATGAPARLVQQQLPEHLLRTLERHLQALPPGTGPDRPAGVSLEGSLRQHGAHLFSMSLQALGLGAMTAEVQEGWPGGLPAAVVMHSMLVGQQLHALLDSCMLEQDVCELQSNDTR
jgi:hypothetical protein